MSETKTLAINEDLGRPKIDNMNINCRQHAIPALDNNITPTPWYVSAFNPIPLDILRSRAKIIPQIKGKLQGVPNWHPLDRNRIKLKQKLVTTTYIYTMYVTRQIFLSSY